MSPVPRALGLALAAALAIAAVNAAQPAPDDRGRRIAAIHERVVFADIHAHPSRFHRANVTRIDADEIARYRRGSIDLVVANVSSDAAFHGGYVRRDGTQLKRLQGNDVYPLRPGEAFAFTLDRLAAVFSTADDGAVALALTPQAVLDAKRRGLLAVMPALEGADGLENRLDHLRDLHARGVRLVQLMHFLDNGIGSNQTPPHEDRGLTAFGRDLVRELNRLGIVIDLAHANTRTIEDVLEISTHPVVFSHTGAKALHEGDRYVTDAEIRAIAARGGVIGIWPTADLKTIEGMVRHIDHVKRLVGVEHLAIGSDLRGMTYIEAFGEDANFRAIVDGLFDAGYADDEVGRIMGGNFFRVWETVIAGADGIR
jgi:membrane dipeptidase